MINPPGKRLSAIDQTEFNGLYYCDKWRLYRDTTELLDRSLARVAELEESAKLSNAVKLGEMLEASRARVAKLEETLESMAKQQTLGAHGDKDGVNWFIDRARQALKTEPETEGKQRP